MKLAIVPLSECGQTVHTVPGGAQRVARHSRTRGDPELFETYCPPTLPFLGIRSSLIAA